MGKHEEMFLSKMDRPTGAEPIPPTWSPTGLKKVCPRCGREGTVFIDDAPVVVNGVPEPSFAIEWDGSPRGGMRQDRDRCLRLVALFDTNFGCGYDKA